MRGDMDRNSAVVTAVIFLALGMTSCAQTVTPKAESGPTTQSVPSPESAADAVLGNQITKRDAAVRWMNDHPDAHTVLAARLLKGGATLHFDGVRSLGKIKSSTVSEALRRAVLQPNFLWKPMALEALADHADTAAANLFDSALLSPVTRSRAAGARGLSAIRRVKESTVLPSLTDDPEASVRLEATKALVAEGSALGLISICRDLTLDRKFGDFDPGKQARLAAADYLRLLGANVPSIDAPLSLVDASAVAKSLISPLASRGIAFTPTTFSSHPPDVAPMPFLIEVRSCSEGDLFFRADAAGRIVLGRDRLTAATVSSSDIAPLVQKLTSLDLGPKGRRILGPVNCDFIRIVRTESPPGSLLVGIGKGIDETQAVNEVLAGILTQVLGGSAGAAHTRRAAAFLSQ